MTYSPVNSEAPFLPESIYLPSDPAQLIIRLTQILNAISFRVNLRDIAIFEKAELLTGQSWFSLDQNMKRQTFRKVILIPVIAAAGTTSVPHGLGNITGFTFTRIQGTAQNAAGTLFIPLPQATPDDVAITVDATNVNIIAATATYNNFSGLVVLEYLKN